jgi:hypothetical protein
MVAADVVSAVAVALGAPLAACFLALMAAVLVPAMLSLVLHWRLDQNGGV